MSAASFGYSTGDDGTDAGKSKNEPGRSRHELEPRAAPDER